MITFSSYFAHLHILHAALLNFQESYLLIALSINHICLLKLIILVKMLCMYLVVACRKSRIWYQSTISACIELELWPLCQHKWQHNYTSLCVSNSSSSLSNVCSCMDMISMQIWRAWSSPRAYMCNVSQETWFVCPCCCCCCVSWSQVCRICISYRKCVHRVYINYMLLRWCACKTCLDRMMMAFCAHIASVVCHSTLLIGVHTMCTTRRYVISFARKIIIGECVHWLSQCLCYA